jgi:hypothetical protein
VTLGRRTRKTRRRRKKREKTGKTRRRTESDMRSEGDPTVLARSVYFALAAYRLAFLLETAVSLFPTPPLLILGLLPSPQRIEARALVFFNSGPVERQ